MADMGDAYERGWKDSRQVIADWKRANEAGAGWRLLAVLSGVAVVIPAMVLWIWFTGVELRSNALTIAWFIFVMGCCGIYMGVKHGRIASREAFAEYHEKWGK